MAPSEPATPAHPPLPMPPFNPGQFLNNLGGGLMNIGSQALFHQAPQNVGPEFSSFGSGMNSFASGIGQQISRVPGELQSFGQSNPGQLLREFGDYAFLPAQTIDPQSDLRRVMAGQAPQPRILPQVGAQLNRGLGFIQNETNPTPGNPLSPIDAAKQGIHDVSIAGQGVGNLMQDQPNFEKHLVDAFKLGFSPNGSTLNPLDDEQGKKAINELYEASGLITDDLFDPQLIHRTIYDNMLGGGHGQKDAQNAADALAAPVANLATFLSPTPLAKVMLFEFVAQFAMDPGATLNAAKQSGGQFFDLLGSTANYALKGGPAPDPQKISDGLIGLANTIGLLSMARHTATKALGGLSKASGNASTKMANRAVDNLQAKTLGQDAPASEMADRIAQAAEDNAAQTTLSPDTINFGDRLQQPEYASLRSAVAEGNRMSNDEIVSDAEHYGAKVYPQGTEPEGRGRTGFVLDDGRYVELPNYTDGYRQHGRLLEDMGFVDKEAGVPEVTQVNRFLRDTGAMREASGTEFTSYGISPKHADTITRSLMTYSGMRNLGANIEDVRAGKSYAFQIGTLADNGWDLAKTLRDPDTRVYHIQGADDYGPEDLRKAPQASAASSGSETNQPDQTSEAGTSQAARGFSPNGPGEGSTIAAEEQADKGFPGANLPESYAQPAAPALRGFSRPIEAAAALFGKTGLNNDGLINTIAHEPEKQIRYGGWRPDRPNEVTVADISRADVWGMVNEWQRKLKTARTELDKLINPTLRAKRELILDSQEQWTKSLKTKSAEMFQSETLAHEAIHAGLGHVIGLGEDPSYRPDGNWQAAFGAKMLQALSSSPEGRTWLRDVGDREHLPWQVKALQNLIDSMSNKGYDPSSASDIERFARQIENSPSAKIWNQAGSELNEHLTQQILIGHDLAHVPYSRQAGVYAESRTFWDPEGTAANGDIAKAWWDSARYSKTPDVLPGTESGPAVSGDFAAAAPASARSASDESGQGSTNQEGLTKEEVIGTWKNALEFSAQHLADLESGKSIGNPTLVKQLKMNIQLLDHRIKNITDNPQMTLETAIRQADAFIKTHNAADFQHPQVTEIPKEETPAPSVAPATKLTPESAQQMVGEVKKAQATRQQPTAPKQRTLADINALKPAPTNYSDSRLTDADRNKIARFAMGEMNRANRAAEVAEAKGDTDGALQARLKAGAVAATWKQFFKEPDTYKVTKAPKPVDYVSEANRIVQGSDQHPLAPLKGLADSLTKSIQSFEEGKAAGMAPADLIPLQNRAQMDMAKFRSAHDLYNSRAFKVGIDKSSFNWNGTRKLARRVAASGATPTEQARMAARLIGEQILKKNTPYTLADAGEDLRQTALGISKVAKNWHPELKKILAGEVWQVARSAYEADPSLPLGVKNIPVHDMIDTPEPAVLKQQLDDINSKFKEQIGQFDQLRTRAKTLEATGRLAKGTVAGMDKDQRAKNLAFSNERLRIQSTIDNHSLTQVTRAVNHYLIDAKDIAAAKNVDPKAAQNAHSGNPNAGKPVETLIAEAEALNERLKQPVPNPFSLDSFMDEGKSAEALIDEGGGGNGEGPPGGEPPIGGQPWFSPGWSKALTDIREMGGNHTLLGDLVDRLLKDMGDHIDPSKTSMMHPAQWFKFHWERLMGIPTRVHQIESTITKIVNQGIKDSKDQHWGRDILRAIDDTNDVAQMQQSGALTPEQAKLAAFLNEYWKSTRKVFSDPKLGPDPLIGHWVDNYVPHVVLADPEGKALFDEKKQMWSRKSGFARQRVQQGATGEPVFRQLQDLESNGYKVSYDVAKIFAAHANSTYRMMQIKELMNTMKGSVYTSPDGKFKGFAVVSTVPDRMGRSQLDKLKGDNTFQGMEIFDTNDAKVRFGPGDSMFQNFRVHPELARYIERLASMNDLKIPGMAPARFFRALGSLFKWLQFSINPRHAFNIYSNVANMTSAYGVLDPRLFHTVYGRANRAMLPEDRSTLHRLTHPNDIANQKRSLDRIAEIERNMHSVFQTAQNFGFDMLDPSPNGLTPAQAALKDRLVNLQQELIDQHRVASDGLAARDRELFASLMGKGLVPDHDLIQGADLGALSNFNEKIPGIAQFHRWMWRDVVWRGQIGVAMHLADQFTLKAAKKNGWDGAGGITAAEKYVPDDLLDGIHREAVYTAKQATGLLNKLDMSTNWQVYGRAALISAPWTMGQLQSARDTMGNNVFSRMLGRQDFTKVSERQLQSGFTKDKAMFLDNMHTKLARRMVYAGTMKLLMTSMFMNMTMGYLLTNQIQTPIQNFLRDPMHTFDVYGGRDPATKHPIWINNQFYGFQRELVNYVLAGAKAAMEGKNPIEVGTDPIVRFMNKDNPMINLVFDTAFGIEISRYLAGFDPSQQKDADLQNLHAAMDQLGIHDSTGIEDRALYALRVLAPAPGGFETTAVKRDSNGQPVTDINGNQIPLTDPRSLLNDFGIGGFLNPAMDLVNLLSIPVAPDRAERMNEAPGILQNLGEDGVNAKLGLFFAGTNEAVSTPLYDPQVSLAGIQNNQDPNGYFPTQAKLAASQESHEQSVARDQAMVQISNLAVQGTPEAYQQIAQIRDQNNLTDSQVIDALLYKTSVQDNNGKFHNAQGILGARQPASGIVTINGQQLSESESAQFNKMKNNRQLDIIQKLQNSAAFKNADSTTKTIMINQTISLSDKFNTAQASQQFLGSGGTKLQDTDFNKLIEDSMLARQDVESIVKLTPEYQNADSATQTRLMQSFLTMSDTIAWNKNFGNLKGMNKAMFENLVINSIQAETSATSYLKQTPFYQAANPADQASLEKEYSDLAKQTTLNIYSGKTSGMNSLEVPMYMHAIVNTEETAKYLLHQSDFYQNASLQDQASLDNKYKNYARQLSLKDWQKGTPLISLDSLGEAYNSGSEQVIVGHLLAEQGYNDLQEQFGGAKTITAYQQQIADMKKQVKEEMVGTPTQISRVQTLMQRNFELANPNYAAFLKARTAWERGTQIGRLYLALNADEQALANIDTSIISDATGINAGNDLTQSIDSAMLMGGDTTSSQSALDPSMVDMSDLSNLDPTMLASDAAYG